jgi:hypothetical protein
MACRRLRPQEFANLPPNAKGYSSKEDCPCKDCVGDCKYYWILSGFASYEECEEIIGGGQPTDGCYTCTSSDFSGRCCGTCRWFWDGSNWTLIQNNCASACNCANTPPNPGPGSGAEGESEYECELNT